ncbi:MAG: SdrD B-like domain-containing protein, partial [Ilumatobacteraceae bacterium]
GSIRIGKRVVYQSDVDIDSDQVFDFSGDLGAFSLADGESEQFLDLPAGTYVVGEELLDSWFFFSVFCEGNTDFDTSVNFATGEITIGLDPGEDIFCRFDNDRDMGRLKIVKQVAGAVPAQDWAFDLAYDGASVSSPFATVPAAGGSSEFISVPTGTYDLSEVLQDGYSVTGIDCGAAGANVDLAAGTVEVTIADNQDVTCTVTNSQNGSIRIGKRVVYQSDVDIDSDQVFDFSGDLGAFSLADGESEQFLDLPAGTYVVGEELLDSWFFFSVFCEGNTDFDTSVNFSTGELTIELDPGENIFCRFDNDRDTGDIRVLKYQDTNGDGDQDGGEGPLDGWDFVVKHEGTVVAGPTTTGASGIVNFNNLPTATYEVCEVSKPGWTNTDPGGDGCETVELDVRNELASISFGNKAGVITPLIAIDKQPPAATEAGAAVVDTYVVTNPGTVPLTDVGVSDDLCGAATYVSGDDGDDELDPGEEWIFTCAYVPAFPTYGSAGGALTNVATATGSYAGAPVSASDHATLTPFVLKKALYLYWDKASSKYRVPYTPADTTSFSVDVVRDDVLVGTFAVGRNGPLELWLSDGDYRFEEVDLPPGYVPIVETVEFSTSDAGARLNTRVIKNVVMSDLAVDKTGPPTARKGSTVTYLYAVTNAGPASVRPKLADNKCSNVRYVRGDADKDGRVDPGETWTYTCRYTVSAKPGTWITNVATVVDKDKPHRFQLGGDTDSTDNRDTWTLKVVK